MTSTVGDSRTCAARDGLVATDVLQRHGAGDDLAVAGRWRAWPGGWRGRRGVLVPEEDDGDLAGVDGGEQRAPTGRRGGVGGEAAGDRLGGAAGLPRRAGAAAGLASWSRGRAWRPWWPWLALRARGGRLGGGGRVADRVGPLRWPPRTPARRRRRFRLVRGRGEPVTPGAGVRRPARRRRRPWAAGSRTTTEDEEDDQDDAEGKTDLVHALLSAERRFRAAARLDRRSNGPPSSRSWRASIGRGASERSRRSSSCKGDDVADRPRPASSRRSGRSHCDARRRYSGRQRKPKRWQPSSSLIPMTLNTCSWTSAC